MTALTIYCFVVIRIAFLLMLVLMYLWVEEYSEMKHEQKYVARIKKKMF